MSNRSLRTSIRRILHPGTTRSQLLPPTHPDSGNAGAEVPALGESHTSRAGMGVPRCLPGAACASGASVSVASSEKPLAILLQRAFVLSSPLPPVPCS